MPVPVVNVAAAVVTGSTSIRVEWLTEDKPTSFYLVYRSLTNSFGASTLIATVANDVNLYNDYGLNPATQYFYWVVRQLNSVNSAQSLEIDNTTSAASVLEDPFDSTKRDAIWQWANDALASLYPVVWRYQPLPQEHKPRVILNFLNSNSMGPDDTRNALELVAGARTGTISVLVVSDPQPPIRGLVTVNTLAAGQYLLKLNGVDYSKTYGSTPASKDLVLKDLLAAIDKNLFEAWIYGVAGAVEGIAVKTFDPDVALVMDNTANLAISSYLPPDAQILANRLASSLGDQNLRDVLNAANIGIGTVNNVNDVSGQLDTRSELRAQFDFKVNLSSNMPVTAPIIDGITSLAGTITN